MVLTLNTSLKQKNPPQHLKTVRTRQICQTDEVVGAGKAVSVSQVVAQRNGEAQSTALEKYLPKQQMILLSHLPAVYVIRDEYPPLRAWPVPVANPHLPPPLLTP